MKQLTKLSLALATSIGLSTTAIAASNQIKLKRRECIQGGIPMNKGFSKLASVLPFALLGTTSFFTLPTYAASVMEELVVTAQRTEENLQDVPIAVTAISGEMLENKGIVNASDLQMSAPNVSFTATNFGGSSFSIRGIGRLVVASGADDGVSTHINQVPLTTNLNAIEFFDVERVEILRGPQGTLFGRNATGGSVNVVTNMPTFDGVEGFVDVEAGDYNNVRAKGAINIPFTETMGIRIAGFTLERDGYIENLAAKSVAPDGSMLSGIDDDIDGRDIQAIRATYAWEFSDNGNLWVQYSRFDEDDDRARITNQICAQSALPILGCDADGIGFDSPHLGATTGGLFFALNGQSTIQLGATGEPGVNGIEYDHIAPPLGLREMFTDFEPRYEIEEEIWTVGADYSFENYTVSFLGGYRKNEYLANMDYNMDVGPLLPPSPDFLGLNGRWPTSAPAGGAGADVTPGPCNYYDGTAGFFGGCEIPGADTRLFAMDQASSETEAWTAEIRVASELDGMFNFQVGISAYNAEGFGDYYVNSNGLDSVGLLGAPLTGFPPLYPTMFNVPGDPNDPGFNEGQAIFAETYFDLNDRLKLTFGLRYNKDEKNPRDGSAFLSSLSQSWLLDFGYVPAFMGLDKDTIVAIGRLDPDYQEALDSLPGGRWGRGGTIMIGPFSAEDQARLDFHGVPQAQVDAAAATLPFSPERAEILRAIGTIPGFNEVRTLTNSPTNEEWTSTTGRVGLDYQLTDDVLIYGFFSRGYKPGGFNPPISPDFQDDTSFTFDEEEVDSIEVGFKSLLFDGQVVLNGSVFKYDYTGLQVTRIRNNSSINENIDADIMGVELEWVYQPSSMENFGLDGSFSWLSTDIGSVSSVDVTNKTLGDPNWISLKDIGPGASTGTNFIADRTALTSAFIDEAHADLGALSDVNGRAVLGTINAEGVPSYWSRSYLTGKGVATSAGIPGSLSGNNLPNSPEFSLNLGVQYTWPIEQILGAVTLRWDYYWQDDSYAREFNTRGDEINSWDQHNLSFIYESDNGNWQARLWARNLEDEDNVTGHYVTSDTSGYFRNYFLTEPRLYGLSVRYQFGGG